MPGRLELLRMEIATYLVEMESLLPRDQWTLTLIARHKTNEDSHVCVSADDWEKIIPTVEQLLKTTKTPTSDELISVAESK